MLNTIPDTEDIVLSRMVIALLGLYGELLSGNGIGVIVDLIQVLMEHGGGA